jgi:hypothetical protein
MLDVLGVRIRLTGAGSDRLEAIYPLWCRPDDGAGVDACLVCDLRENADALVAFQHDLDAAVLANLRDLVPVHAGVVEMDGRLIVLPAPSGSGKSSLVAHLIRRGARYLSDEYAFIDARGRVHAYPRPPMLRDARGRSVLDLTVVNSLIACPLPRLPDCLLFLEHRPDEPSATLDEITASAATLELLRNTPQTWRARPALVPHLARAAASAIAHRGVRGDAAAAWDAIEARLAAHGSALPRTTYIVTDNGRAVPAPQRHESTPA